MLTMRIDPGMECYVSPVVVVVDIKEHRLFEFSLINNFPGACKPNDGVQRCQNNQETGCVGFVVY